MHIDFILIVPQCVMLHFRKNLFVNMFCINLWLNLRRISISTMIKPWPNFRRSSLNNNQGNDIFLFANYPTFPRLIIRVTLTFYETRLVHDAHTVL